MSDARSGPPAAPFGRETIESIIPHRPPFLLVDEVLELEPGRRVRGRFHVPADGWWFRGHFPDRPVMPGVLTIEAIAQCGAVAGLRPGHENGVAEARVIETALTQRLPDPPHGCV